jgi:glycosyltransferase involved in cell wall biosynthesis
MTYDIICLSTTDWDEIWGSRQQIMERLAAQGHRILFVERQVGPEHLLRDPILRARKRAAWRKQTLRQLKLNLWLFQPSLMLPGRYFSITANTVGQHMLARRLRSLITQLGFENPILWIYPPHSAPLLGQFNERLSVYHCIERFIGNQAGRKRHVMEIEENALLRLVNLVFAHSEGLRQRYTPITRQPVVLLPSAADVAHFQSTSEVHPDVAVIPHPRLGLAGSIDGRIDVKLLQAVSQARPDWHIVLIGQTRPGRVDLSGIMDESNVHLLGARPFADLPSLLNGMDTLLIPYVHDELTDYISPIKLYEYLAVGKSIISVDLPEVRPLAQWISIAETPAEWIAAIEEALLVDTPERIAARRNVAWKHTWDERINTINLQLATLNI